MQKALVVKTEKLEDIQSQLKLTYRGLHSFISVPGLYPSNTEKNLRTSFSITS